MKAALALALPLICGAALTACGGGVPGNAVATVDGTPISQSAFNHWLAIANKSSSAQQGTTAGSPLPDPPNFTKCVAYLQATQPKAAAGTKPPTAAQLKAQCQQQYQQLLQQVMQFLISGYWLQGEAHNQGISVSDADVQKQFQQLKSQQFQTPAQYQQFLASSGMTEQDLLYRVKLNLLSQKLQAKISKPKPVTQEQIANYYNQNKSHFGQPEQRDLRIMLVKNPTQADALAAQLKHGASFAALARKYSIDPTTKSSGGAKIGAEPGEFVEPVNTAIFKAQKDQIVGPIKTPFGYYIFRVQKITPGNQKTLAQSQAQVKQLLQSQNAQQAVQAFVANFTKTWKAKTDCRSDYAVSSCKNAPKTSTTGVATGATG
jgi:foldase protein PrsA